MKQLLPPYISVVIPVYNAEKHLEEAIQSILSQKYPEVEIILVNDGSEDNSAEIINKYVQNHHNIISIYQVNSGPSAARNKGIKLAKGNFITFLDSDDYWPETCIQAQIQYLNRNPNSKIVWGKTQFFRINNSKDVETIGMPLHFLNVGSAIFHRTLFDLVGLFDESLSFSEDLDWFSRAREAGVKIVKHPETVLFYRSHEANMTKSKGVQDLNLMKVLKKSLDRRRNKKGTDIELPDIAYSDTAKH